MASITIGKLYGRIIGFDKYHTHREKNAVLWMDEAVEERVRNIYDQKMRKQLGAASASSSAELSDPTSIYGLVTKLALEIRTAINPVIRPIARLSRIAVK